MIKLNQKKNIKGFTLLEALVAISILMVAVVAPITIAQKGLSSASYSKNQMIASYLAQDAIEYIKNKRDINIINNGILQSNWLNDFEDCFDLNYCAIDTVTTGPSVITNEDNVLNKDTYGFYSYDTGDSTNFTRKINIKLQEIDGSNDQALITVIVSWGGTDNQVIVKTLIYNI